MKWLWLCVVLAGCADPRPVDDGRRCATEADCVNVHPTGIADPASDDFHGKWIPQLGWDLHLCARCHGEDFSGGVSQKTCLGCHTQGPTACTTCHDQPPASGAHAAHAPRFACSECHVVPETWDAPGHLTHGALTFGPLASSHGATPHAQGGTCADTYCHGPATPSWTGGPSQASCGSCHGAPPATPTHVVQTCASCHPAGRHVDGVLDVGDGKNTCESCHPTASLGGAHTAHLTAAHRITRKLACDDCHRLPTQLHDPGHIDQPTPAVFPAGSSLLARADGAQPGFANAAQTCGDVYCHGGGTRLGADQAAGVVRTPSWTTTPTVLCGGCHGVPPVDGAHPVGLKLADCATCHAGAIDATGQLLAKHLDGVIDAQ